MFRGFIGNSEGTCLVKFNMNFYAMELTGLMENVIDFSKYYNTGVFKGIINIPEMKEIRAFLNNNAPVVASMSRGDVLGVVLGDKDGKFTYTTFGKSDVKDFSSLRRAVTGVLSTYINLVCKSVFLRVYKGLTLNEITYKDFVASPNILFRLDRDYTHLIFEDSEYYRNFLEKVHAELKDAETPEDLFECMQEIIDFGPYSLKSLAVPDCINYLTLCMNSLVLYFTDEFKDMLLGNNAYFYLMSKNSQIRGIPYALGDGVIKYMRNHSERPDLHDFIDSEIHDDSQGKYDLYDWSMRRFAYWNEGTERFSSLIYSASDEEKCRMAFLREMLLAKLRHRIALTDSEIEEFFPSGSYESIKKIDKPYEFLNFEDRFSEVMAPKVIEDTEGIKDYSDTSTFESCYIEGRVNDILEVVCNIEEYSSDSRVLITDDYSYICLEVGKIKLRVGLSDLDTSSIRVLDTVSESPRKYNVEYTIRGLCKMVKNNSAKEI